MHVLHLHERTGIHFQLRIAIITDGIWPYVIGGMQKHSYYLCKYLLQNGVAVDLYHSAKKFPVSDIHFEHFTEDEKKNLAAFMIEYPSGSYFPGHYLWDSYRYSRSLFRELGPRLQSYSLIYIQGFSGWYLLEQKRHQSGFPPCLLNFHGLEMFQRAASFRSGLEQRLFRPFAANILRKADHVQSLGGRLTGILGSIGIERNRIIECGIGVDDDWTGGLPATASPGDGRRVFTFIGRYERRKGIEELNKVIGRLKGRYDFEFHFVGPIPDGKKLDDNNCIYHGLVRDTDSLKAILDKTDFLVAPSMAEGMPTVILEAMSRGCAIIATDVGAVAEQVSSKNGILIPAADILSLEEAMIEAICMADATLQQKKRASVVLVKNKFTWSRLADKMIGIFDTIIKGTIVAVEDAVKPNAQST
jgi:glycosyltransferase involved in cell wall biosynthesis